MARGTAANRTAPRQHFADYESPTCTHATRNLHCGSACSRQTPSEGLAPEHSDESPILSFVAAEGKERRLVPQQLWNTGRSRASPTPTKDGWMAGKSNRSEEDGGPTGGVGRTGLLLIRERVEGGRKPQGKRRTPAGGPDAADGFRKGWQMLLKRVTMLVDEEQASRCQAAFNTGF
jgi:hypothetical protein